MNPSLHSQIGENAKKILEHYTTSFAALYGKKPPEGDYEDGEIARWLVQQYDLDEARALVDGYLTLNDDWLKTKGYPFSYLKRSIKAVIVSGVSSIKPPKKLYTVAFIAGGRPVQSNDPRAGQNINSEDPRVKSILEVGIEVRPEFYKTPVRPWVINDKWYGDPVEASKNASELGMRLLEYEKWCLTSDEAVNSLA